MGNSTWLSSSSLDHSIETSTLPLFDESPVRDIKKVEVQSYSNEVASNVWLKDEVSTLLEELSRVNAENKRLTEMLTVASENYKELKRQLTNYIGKQTTSSIEFQDVAKKRKVESIVDVGNNINHNAIGANNNNMDSSTSDEEDSCEKTKEETVKAKISRVAVRTEASDSTLILKDSYQWRKYGQKVTRDNPCPRAYFKCSFAPGCPVKKKVQRSLEDQSMLVATYEGEHNHAPPTQQETTSGSRRVLTIGSDPCNAQLCSSCPTVTLDLTKPKLKISNESTKMILNSSSQLTKFNSTEFQKVLAEQMASSLTKDPNFTAALAIAVSGRFVHQSSRD